MDSESVISPSPSVKKSSWFRSHRKVAPYLFTLPFGLLFLFFFIVPIFYAVYESLFRSQRSGLGLGAPTISFNGVNNYLQVIHDPDFYTGVGRVLLYGIVQVPVMLGLALLLALLLDSTVVRFKSFYRLAFFVPYAIPGLVAALLWGYLYDPGLSPIVKSVSALGLGTPDFLGANTVLWSIANITTWAWTGYNMLIIFAALQAIPSEIYESARLDGASGWRIAWSIKIPLVAPALILTCIFSIIGTLQLFNEPRVLSSISNNISVSYTPNLYAYNTAFGNNNYYYAAAISVVLALVTCVFSFGFLRITQRQAGV
ncbi:carbohydrate ABC transporter permease [Ktedonobacter racemifer]|jgi:multiple sugar transport system permease protein|uniref:Binding-protein-dependent transport systems inner membrane component n=1 Tax=Ktedonobacter racemifer DSM 44963 TaxID=485913 RepID=D6TBS2_KTERA|nr:sugar ABC transporter permease [Ktedonobacter racemifer]EFH89854.1 binding-protein-dependent transport systems inner membrane component [Ktedonobacter racemifer DSM 44963]